MSIRSCASRLSPNRAFNAHVHKKARIKSGNPKQMYFLSGRVMSEFFLLGWTCTSFAFENIFFSSILRSNIQTYQTASLDFLNSFHIPQPWIHPCNLSLSLPLKFLKSKWISETHCVSTGQLILQRCQEFICMGEREAYFSQFSFC